MSELLKHLEPRVRPTRTGAKSAEKNYARLVKAYEGGTPAEIATLRNLETERQARILRERLACMGRKIDLESLSKQLQPDGSPQWAVVDPRSPISAKNGSIEAVGHTRVGNHYLVTTSGNYLLWGNKTRSAYLPKGIVPLPPRVRELLELPEVNNYTRTVGILYQPEGWLEVRPDPALIVEWTHLMGEYYALAVWGQDKPGIMEFVD